MDRTDAVIIVSKVDGSLQLSGTLLKNRSGFGMGLPYHDGDVRLDDACLFRGYLGECVAKELGVVETYVGDDAEVGGDDVGAVEPSSHAYLHHCHIDLFGCKIVECQPNGHFEEAELQGLHKVAMLLDEVGDTLLGYHLPIDADALAEVHQMGRRVEPHLVARLHEDGSEHVGD